MGFRTGAWAKVWSVEPISDTATKLRISVSRKNKQTNEYEQDFSGFVSVVGSVAAKKAAKLNQGDRIQLVDVDVSTRYDKEKKIEYVNYKMFSFKTENETDVPEERHREAEPAVDDGEQDDSGLPF